MRTKTGWGEEICVHCTFVGVWEGIYGAFMCIASLIRSIYFQIVGANFTRMIKLIAVLLVCVLL